MANTVIGLDFTCQTAPTSSDYKQIPFVLTCPTTSVQGNLNKASELRLFMNPTNLPNLKAGSVCTVIFNDTNTETTAFPSVPQLTYPTPSTAKPTISAIDVAAGGTAGGTWTRLTGTNFLDVSNVKFGTTSVAAGGFVIQSATQIVALAPAHSAATVDITAINPIGTSDTSSADQFVYS